MAILLLAGALLDAPSILATLWPASACYILHLIEGNAVTPVFVGNRLTISPFLVFIAFIFWLWLWGPVGAVLSTPIVIVAKSRRRSSRAIAAIRRRPMPRRPGKFRPPERRFRNRTRA